MLWVVLLIAIPSLGLTREFSEIERCGVTFTFDGTDFWLPRREQDFVLPQTINYDDYYYPQLAPTMKQSADQGDVVARFFNRNPEIASSIVSHSKCPPGMSAAECAGALLRGQLQVLDCDDDEQLRLIAKQACEGQSAPVPIPSLGARSGIGDLLEGEGFTSGVEVGVQKGNNARKMLDRWPSGNLLLVDPWSPMGSTYNDLANFQAPDQDSQDVIFAEAMEAVAPHKERVKVCRGTSATCAPLVEDGSLDFVYIDARHDRASVAEDLRLWWPKLRAGGILAGHDYVTADFALVTGQRWDIGPDGGIEAEGLAVKGAVDDFARETCRQVVVTYDEEQSWFWTWMLRK
ncbi:hypothetical protein TrCOL_g8544 [Triparma columacea]|uniref:Class I SAM-dependent methyltransferase n=1 Tax=Triparma columacea TaxID=722753 RepID=A0A9W7G6G9_9STRA|nr:hypothetical protein TrCOL_g8544 [Triparma columacea]